MTKSIKIIYGLVILAILGFAFYWFQWRPTQIRKECYSNSLVLLNGKVVNGLPSLKALSDSNLFIDCLRQNGLEK